jgi:3-oxoacyl-(acyl-carrier-protein) synthase
MTSSIVQAATDPAGPAAELASLDPVVLAEAEWPTTPSDVLPAIPGFVTSTFSPLVVEVAQRCLHAFFGDPPVGPARGERIAFVLASSTGDLATSAAVAQAVSQQRRVPPMLFYQSTPNAVAGYLTARWALRGPVVCTVPLGDAMADAQACADLLISSGDADAALIIVADQARGPHEIDHAAAVLIGPGSWTERDETT